MKEKSPREQSAAHQQTALLVNALNGAVAGSGYWLNAAGRNLPKFYPKGVAVSPFNSLVLGMHTDQSGYKTGLYTMFSDAKQRGEAILQQEHGVPFNWYKWDKYVNRHNSEDMLSREAYKALPEAQQKLYKGVRQREIMVLFNIDQTTLPMADAEKYRDLQQRFGSRADRGYLQSEERQLRSTGTGSWRRSGNTCFPCARMPQAWRTSIPPKMQSICPKRNSLNTTKTMCKN